MAIDIYGGEHARLSHTATPHYSEAVLAVLSHRAAGPALAQALAADPDCVPAHLLMGFCNVLLARRETIAEARVNLAAAKRNGSCGVREAAMELALAAAIGGDLAGACAGLRGFCEANPRDLLAAKLTQCLQFLAGFGADMPDFTASLLPHWNERAPGYGFLLGCHAFGLEEAGRYREAEAAAQSALHFERNDLWAMHALTHVYEMNGRNREGVLWIESGRDLWGDVPNFGYHLAWHLALFNFNLRRFDRALAIYDSHVRGEQTEDFRDIANAASLLWRLAQEGVNIGARFDELADIARRRAEDTTLVFASLHHLLALLAVRDIGSAERLIAALGQQAAGSCHQSGAARDAGLPLARALLASARDDRLEIDCGQLAAKLPVLGGSHAQRDVFLRSLALMSARGGDRAALDRIWSLRHALRREDHFVHLAETLASKSRDSAGGWRYVA